MSRRRSSAVYASKNQPTLTVYISRIFLVIGIILLMIPFSDLIYTSQSLSAGFQVIDAKIDKIYTISVSRPSGKISSRSAPEYFLHYSFNYQNSKYASTNLFGLHERDVRITEASYQEYTNLELLYFNLLYNY